MDDEHVLACHRHIELNPVRARMVAHPSAYRWSRYACNAEGMHEARIAPHLAYVALGVDASTRQVVDRTLIGEALAPDDVAAVRARTHNSASSATSASALESKRSHSASSASDPAAGFRQL